ncbi:hypothetical protein, partial [Thermomonas sp.]|uniref:hypothetical protein n=1 Tax=Thermomonas sp. TaxID=1971895 RepID=UPI0025CFCC9C
STLYGESLRQRAAQIAQQGGDGRQRATGRHRVSCRLAATVSQKTGGRGTGASSAAPRSPR